ncbi:HalOD1 output domain-containing protein [Saliphagus sp. LR7]|uniref:HalOD1 output domain-containing protein n=1 Tax=Saliphagus sp. LR7 TaxID=2282654 RepID=UPI0013005A57|nr:HalOD1 output domain-containing protein [Saliphagus sp. LR7]
MTTDETDIDPPHSNLVIPEMPDKYMETLQADWTDSGQPDITIVETIAVATNRDPLEMAPLNASIDVDALNALLTRETPDSHTPVQVSFTYEETGTQVTVRSDGQVIVSLDDESNGR